MPLQPAHLAFRDDGTPYSTRYGDVYHTHQGGLAQAQHVFIEGNRLSERWRGRRRFTVLETGFGQGLNFLATWAAWHADPGRCERLHYVSTELHPFSAADLSVLHAHHPTLAAFSAELRAAWPSLTAGFHRLHLAGGAVVLNLLFGDAVTTLRQLDATADAFYLDGFSPACNPDMWSEPLFKELARLAAPGASLATWSVSGAVRRALSDAGFSCEKRPGFGAKREMLCAQYGGHDVSYKADDLVASARHAVVIGAGLAGSSIANRLAERGWQIDVVDTADRPGAGASGNLAGVLRPLPSLDDNRLARLTRAGSLYGTHHLQRLDAAGHGVRWHACGALHLARDPSHLEKQRAIMAAHEFPEDFARFVDRREASEIAEWPLDIGGWWFPHAAWVQPPSLCAANLAAWPQRVRLHMQRHVAEIARRDGHWCALDAAGELIAASTTMILANGVGICSHPVAAALPVRSARGQVAHLPAQSGSAPRVVVCRLGYVSPEVDGLRCAGATFTVDDDDTELRLADQQENLAKLNFVLPGYADGLNAGELSGRVGFRPASPDRLPMVGQVPRGVPVERNTPLHAIAREAGLYAVSGFGARGLVWAALVAETLASQLEGEPLPLERDLVDAIDPARYLLRPARQLRSDA